MQKPLITLVLFAYNQSHYVREAIAGVFAQTYSPLEIILSDDCSTDDTFAIMTEMAANYRGPHHIILNRNEANRGVGAHVNKAFSLASGRWIVTAASDDISDPGRCSRVVELAALHPNAGAIGLGWRNINESGAPFPGKMLQRYLDARCDSGLVPDWISLFQSGDFGVWGMSAAWKTDLIHSWSPLPDESRQEDEIYSFRAALSGYEMILVPDVFASYRHHGSNASGFDNRTATPDMIEERRIGRARMNLGTWRFLRKELAGLRPLPSGLRSENARKQLISILDRKILACEDEATWWECGALGRIRRSFFPAERRKFIHCPREWSRMLPRKYYLGIINRRSAQTAQTQLE
jgi:glycosyltransferase involved in cell wall biosynthesis